MINTEISPDETLLEDNIEDVDIEAACCCCLLLVVVWIV